MSVIMLAAICGVTETAAAGPAAVIRSGPSECPAIALTFDVCPVRHSPGFDAALVDFLVEHHVPATFFLSGRWIARHDTQVRALLAVPFFEIGTHGDVHAHLRGLGRERQRAEIETPVQTLETLYGHRPRLFRPPYGEYDDVTREVVDALGQRFILWSAVSGDANPRLAPERMIEDLQRTLHSGGIVVFHANGNGKHTREVVQALEEGLIRTRGWAPVTVSELLAGCGHGLVR